MKKLLCLLLCCSTLTHSHAQENRVKAQLYGFVRNYFCYDSRKSLESSGDMFYLVPLDKNENSYGDDLNNTPSARLLAITTRLGLSLEGMRVAGASLQGRIEADFNGFSGSSTLLRLRQAYIKGQWERCNLTVGQAWHPMSDCMMPEVPALAQGAPFNPFSRTPQIRYNHSVGTLTLTAALLYQFQYTSTGPAGSSDEYAKNDLVPELYAGATLKSDGFTGGIGVDYLELKPRTTGKDAFDVTVKVSDRVRSLSPLIFASYERGLFSARAKAVYAANCAHLSMMSGYAATSQASDGSYRYAPLRSMAAWGTLSYGKRFKALLFAGYMKNQGIDGDLLSTDLIYVRGYKNIDRMARIAPSLSYNISHFSLAAEYELTAVYYGNTIEQDATVSDTHCVTNSRVCVMAKYEF